MCFTFDQNNSSFSFIVRPFPFFAIHAILLKPDFLWRWAWNERKTNPFRRISKFKIEFPENSTIPIIIFTLRITLIKKCPAPPLKMSLFIFHTWLMQNKKNTTRLRRTKKEMGFRFSIILHGAKVNLLPLRKLCCDAKLNYHECNIENRENTPTPHSPCENYTNMRPPIQKTIFAKSFNKNLFSRTSRRGEVSYATNRTQILKS